MVTGSQAPTDVPAGRSGGKILKARGTTSRKTPYDRPTPPQTQPPLLQPESPSWLSGLALPAKFVAGGATKIFSSFWNPKSWGTPSSSSSDGDSESEDDSGDDENPSDGVIELKQKDSLSEKSRTLHLVEQLLMLEQYSREEGDRLIEIINSRVLDDSMREGVDAGPSMIHSSANNETPLHSQAITEAKKWVAEKKVRSGLKSDFNSGIYALKSAMKPQTIEGEAGSPIDVAKSYMRTRPPWASPIDHDNSLSPLPLAADLFKEKTSYSSGGGVSFSTAKRDHLSAGSWNIQEEIRRVRSKATEDMLSNHRSMKLTSSTLELDTPKNSVANDKPINVVGRDAPIDLETPKSVDEIVNLAADGGTPGLSASDLRIAQNSLPSEALPSHPKMPDLEQYQDTDSANMTDRQDAAFNNSHHVIHSDKEQNTRPSSEGNKIEKEKDERNLDQENDRTVNDRNEADKNCFTMTEADEVPVVNNSKGSPKTNNLREDGTLENRAVTRASRRGKTRGK